MFPIIDVGSYKIFAPLLACWVVAIVIIFKFGFTISIIKKHLIAATLLKGL